MQQISAGQSAALPLPFFVPSLLSRGCPTQASVSVPRFLSAGRSSFPEAACFQCEVSDSAREREGGKTDVKETVGQEVMLQEVQVKQIKTRKETSLIMTVLKLKCSF